MEQPPLSPDEPFRLQALRETQLLDTPIEERFERITRLAQRTFGTPIVAISLVDADRQWFKSIQGLNVSETSREVSFCGHTILEDEILVVPDARVDPRFADNPLVTGDPNIAFYAGCPLRAPNGTMVGSLCIIDRRAREMTEDDVATLRDLGALAQEELAVKQMRNDLVERLAVEQRQALLDPLTRLWNRDGILAQLEHEITRARAADTEVAAMLVDVDHFKPINDTWGHAAGDEVLRQTAQAMLGILREVDSIGRYGGDEFLIVMGAFNASTEIDAVAERLRTRVGQAIKVEGAEVDVTVSIGVARLSSTMSDAASLVRVADAALYCAKRGGRNRVECQTCRTAKVALTDEHAA